MNRVELIGRVTRTLDFHYTKNGYPFATFTIVVDGESRFDKERKESVAPPNFISCVLWGDPALYYAEVGVDKGEKLYVLGELDQSTVERADGEKESKTRVKVHVFRRLSVAPGPVDLPPADF